MDDRLASYEQFEFREGEHAFEVFRKAPASGTAPAIVVMHEVPGVYPSVIDFAERLVVEGYTVYLPSLVGTPGRAFSAPYVLSSLGRACISREFHVLARGESSPITDALRALCRRAHADCGGVGVGAIGMCLTGNFALSLMVDDAVLAGVASQPSMPFNGQSDLHMSAEEVSQARAKLDDVGPMIALRFEGDKICQAEKFTALAKAFNDDKERIDLVTLPGKGHSVFTLDFVKGGELTENALQSVFTYFDAQLKA